MSRYFHDLCIENKGVGTASEESEGRGWEVLVIHQAICNSTNSSQRLGHRTDTSVNTHQWKVCTLSTVILFWGQHRILASPSMGRIIHGSTAFRGWNQIGLTFHKKPKEKPCHLLAFLFCLFVFREKMKGKEVDIGHASGSLEREWKHQAPLAKLNTHYKCKLSNTERQHVWSWKDICYMWSEEAISLATCT